jgi:hypothetical protein
MRTGEQNKTSKYLGVFLFIAITLIAFSSKSQQLEKHRWEKRLVLILTNDGNDTKIQDQLKEFRANEFGMKERKLLVYQITPDEYKEGMEEGKWKKTKTVYEQYKMKDAQPEILLLGLDGGVKLRVAEFLSCKKLFAAIDVMPMRRQEINRKKNAGSSN